MAQVSASIDEFINRLTEKMNENNNEQYAAEVNNDTTATAAWIAARRLAQRPNISNEERAFHEASQRVFQFTYGKNDPFCYLMAPT